jgi:hypothetical protein
VRVARASPPSSPSLLTGRAEFNGLLASSHAAAARTCGTGIYRYIHISIDTPFTPAAHHLCTYPQKADLGVRLLEVTAEMPTALALRSVK